MLTYFDRKALSLIRQYGHNNASPQEIARLGDDLQAIADEPQFDQQDDEADAANAAMILRQRIGGWNNLNSYLDCLNVHVTKDSRKADV
jgi:hypothetical protein